MTSKVLIAVIALALGFAQDPGPKPQDWKQATAGYVFEFPRDHASHPDYKIEWWYYTGNVETTSGRRFGYQVTFFRVGVDPAPANPSAWAVRDLYMAHLAVSDPAGQRYRFDEKLTRGGPGLSGADPERYRVWNEDWRAGLDANGRHTISARGRNVGVGGVEAAARQDRRVQHVEVRGLDLGDVRPAVRGRRVGPASGRFSGVLPRLMIQPGRSTL